MRQIGSLLLKWGQKAEQPSSQAAPAAGAAEQSIGELDSELDAIMKHELPLKEELNERLREFRHSLHSFETDHYAVVDPHPNGDDHILSALLSLNPPANLSPNSLLPGYELSGNLVRIRELSQLTEEPALWNAAVKEIQDMALRLKGKVHDGVHYEESARRAMNEIKHIDDRFDHKSFMGPREYPDKNRVPFINRSRQWFQVVADHQSSRPSSRFLQANPSSDGPLQSRLYDSAESIQKQIEEYLFPVELLSHRPSPARARVIFARQVFVQSEELGRLLGQLKKKDHEAYNESVQWILLHRQRNIPGVRLGRQVLEQLYQMTGDEAFKPNR